jgi:hypothetical protein
VSGDLVEFLRARYGEIEAAAQAAAGPDWFLDSTEDSGQRSIRYTGPSTLHPGALADYYVADRVDEHDAAHIALHDPARVLRRDEAGRKLLNEYLQAAEAAADDWPEDSGYRAGLLFAIKCWVAEFSDHPDYQESWKP